MKLNEYLIKTGDEPVAQALCVKVRTVASWRRGERIPRPEQALRLVDFAGGELTLADIYAAQSEAA